MSYFKRVYDQIFEKGRSGYTPGKDKDGNRRERLDYAMTKLVELDANSFIDVGCGWGQLFDYPELANMQKVGFDLTNRCNSKLDHFIKGDLFIPNDLARLREIRVDVVVSLDTLEHLSPVKVPEVLHTFATIGKWAIFTIANHSSKFEGIELHLTQRKIKWWRDRLVNVYAIVEEHQKSQYLYYFVLESRI